MRALCVSKVKFSEVLDQVFADLQSEFLGLFKASLEGHLEALRDRIIGTRRYQRGNTRKRWGYTVRKSIQIPVGELQQVRIPRIRDHAHEISLFCDRYVKRAGIITALIIEMFLWGMSTRRLSILSKKLYGIGLTPTSISRLKQLVAERVAQMRSAPIAEDIQILVIDGLHGKFRKRGQGVCLLAIGLDGEGHATLLDWSGCSSESAQNWRRLFRRLKKRGLKRVKLVVSDDASGVPQAIRDVWGEECEHQLCLWHFSREVAQCLKRRSPEEVEEFMRDYWEIFNARTPKEAAKRWKKFLHTWQARQPAAISKMKNKHHKLFCFLQYPSKWRHRIRTVNLAERFFAQLQTFLQRFPGWIDEEHIALIVGLFIQGMKLFQRNQENYYAQEILENILNTNFNRIT